MVVHDFNVVWAILAPFEAQPPLLIDPNAVLSSAIATQSLEAIAWQTSKRVECIGGIQNAEAFFGLTRKFLKLSYLLTVE